MSNLAGQVKRVESSLTPKDSIFATGVFLQPYLGGDNIWRWRVMCFEDDSYLNGEICNPVSECVADTCEGLLWADEA